MNREATINHARQIDEAELQALGAMDGQHRHSVEIKRTVIGHRITDVDQLVQVRQQRRHASVREQRRTGAYEVEEAGHSLGGRGVIAGGEARQRRGAAQVVVQHLTRAALM